MKSIIEIRIDENNNIKYYNPGGFESRCESTINLFQEAFSLIQDKCKFRINHFCISTLDISHKINKILTLGYTCSDGVIACPDFTFDKWVETGVQKYESTVEEIIAAGNKHYSIGKLFWIGTLSTQLLRYKLLHLGELYNDKLEILSMEWQKEHLRGHMHKQSQYVSLPDHANYKYLLDCGAGGWSARLKFLLFTNRPLFLVERDRNKQDFFYDQLVPYKHFIPVWGDLSNLISQVEWADKNYNEALAIAENARKFAIEKLNKKEVINYLAGSLTKHLS
jgi:hypothetical protein